MTTKKVYYNKYMEDLEKTIVTLERKQPNFERYVKITEIDYNSKWGWESGIPGGNGEDDIYTEPKELKKEIDLLKDEEEHYEYLNEKYGDYFNFDMKNLLNINNILLIYNLGYINFTIKCLIIWFAQILKYLEINYDSISVKVDDSNYVYTKYEEDKNDSSDVNYENKICKKCKYIKEKENIWSQELGFQNISELQKFITKHKKDDNISDLEINQNKKSQNQFKYVDNYVNYILKENNEQRENRISNNLRKNLLKNKCLSILKEDKIKFINLKNQKDEKEKKLNIKLKRNITKYKIISCLRNLLENKNNIDKIIETVKKYKNRLKFDDEELNKCALENNRSKINFFSKLYEKKVLKNELSSKDFLLAVEEYHTDRNITRMTKICEICYNLRKNNIIWTSNIIFKSLYIFQYTENYQIPYLIKKLEKLIYQ